jgi:hypothetical protein
MDGIVYLLNQAGVALSQANAEINALREQIARLTATLEDRTSGEELPYSS